jgi:Rieske 2Fe-2S family protein
VTQELVPSLDRAAYLDDRVWERERERIFAREWCAVARGHDIAAEGDFAVVDLVGESLVLVRDDGGALRAFFNVCRHRGAQLFDTEDAVSGRITGAIRCPYHGWTYGLDGALRRAPYLDVDLAAFPLHQAGCAEWGGFVFVRLASEGAPLAEQLGPVPERLARYPLAELRRGARIEYAVAANWKVLAENYNECYHCGTVHPELCELVPGFRHGGRDLDWEAGIPHRDGAWTFTRSGTSDRAPFPGLDADERVRHKGELVYPNLFLSLAADHVAAFSLFPIAPDRTRVVFDVLFHPDAVTAAGFDPWDAVELWDVTNRQDWAICERVQRGMRSRVWQHGWFAPMEDLSLDIREWYAPRMAPDRPEPE